MFSLLSDGLTSIASGVTKVFTDDESDVAKIPSMGGCIRRPRPWDIPSTPPFFPLLQLPKVDVNPGIIDTIPSMGGCIRRPNPWDILSTPPCFPFDQFPSITISGASEFGALIFETLTKPWKLSKIKPLLQFYRIYHGKVKKFTLEYEETTDSSWHKQVPEKFFKVARLIFVAHGFLSSHTCDWMDKMTDALLYKETNCTVVRVGWERGAKINFSVIDFTFDPLRYEKLVLSYNQAAMNCKAVGKWLGEIIRDLIYCHRNLKIHCIGHSLGAHLMGFAGKVYNAIDRITGLDPAGPGFQNASSSERLNKSDAKFVDVIHTDGYGYVYYFGTLLPMGDIDFYPNWGYHQKQFSGPAVNVKDISSCHSVAVNYFIHSIINQKAFKTDSELCERPEVEKIKLKYKKFKYWVNMGFNLESYRDQLYASHTKCFYLDTDSDSDSDTDSKYFLNNFSYKFRVL